LSQFRGVVRSIEYYIYTRELRNHILKVEKWKPMFGERESSGGGGSLKQQGTSITRNSGEAPSIR